MRVLLIGKKTAFVFELSLYLSFEGEHVTWAASCDDAIGLAATSTFDVVVISDQATADGTDHVRTIQATLDGTPILALSGVRRPEPSRAQALATGIDTMFGPSLSNAKVLTRLRAMIRHRQGYSEPILRVGIVQLNSGAQEVEVDGTAVQLRPREFELLELLMMCTNTVLSKEAVLAHLYDGVDEPSPQIVDVLVCKLRSKLADAGASEVIRTIYGRGYMIPDVVKHPCIRHCPTPSRLLPT